MEELLLVIVLLVEVDVEEESSLRDPSIGTPMVVPEAEDDDGVEVVPMLESMYPPEVLFIVLLLLLLLLLVTFLDFRVPSPPPADEVPGVGRYGDGNCCECAALAL